MQQLKYLMIFGVFSAYFQLYAIEPIVESEFYNKVMHLEEEGSIQVLGERRGYIKQNTPLNQKMTLQKSKEYVAVVVTDKNLENIDLKISNKKGKETVSHSNGKQILFLKIEPLKKNQPFLFELKTDEIGGYYHFFLISENREMI